MRNTNGFFQLAVFALIAGTFVSVMIRDRHPSAQRVERGKQEVELSDFLEQLGHGNADYQKVFTVVSYGQPLTVQGSLPTQAEINVVRRHVRSTFGLNGEQVDQMVKIHLSKDADAR